MKPSEAYKLQSIIDSIQEKDFTPIYVDQLLIMLREYLDKSKYPKLHDLTHFIAHNETRNQGCMWRKISLGASFSRIFQETTPEHLMDQSAPLCVKDFFILHLENFQPLGPIHGIPRKRLKPLIDLVLLLGPKQDRYYFIRPEGVSESEMYAVEALGGYARGEIFYKQEELINDLTSCIRQLGFQIADDKFKSSQVEIMCSILLIIHGSDFTWQKHSTKALIHKEDDDTLMLRWDVTSEFKGQVNLGKFDESNYSMDVSQKVSQSFPLLSTTIKYQDVCDLGLVAYLKKSTDDRIMMPKIGDRGIPQNVYLDTKTHKICLAK